ncbi:MAG: hypothetical protein ABI292_00275 [Rhodoferax sp.]
MQPQAKIPPRRAILPGAPAGASVAATTPRAARTPRGRHYHVYVIELADQVWTVGWFCRTNPGYQLGKPFVYVGMTGLDPDVRFDKHKAGYGCGRRSWIFFIPALGAWRRGFSGSREKGVCFPWLRYGAWCTAY